MDSEDRRGKEFSPRYQSIFEGSFLDHPINGVYTVGARSYRSFPVRTAHCLHRPESQLQLYTRPFNPACSSERRRYRPESEDGGRTGPFLVVQADRYFMEWPFSLFSSQARLITSTHGDPFFRFPALAARRCTLQSTLVIAYPQNLRFTQAITRVRFKKCSTFRLWNQFGHFPSKFSALFGLVSNTAKI